MSTLDEEVYLFCDEDISSYEMTIYTLAMAYAKSPLFALDDEKIRDLAQLLIVDEELLRHALVRNTFSKCSNFLIKFGEKTFECTEFFDNTFFDSIIKLHRAYKELNKISDTTEEKSIIENIRHLQFTRYCFTSINVNNAAKQCLSEQCISYKHTVYDSGVFLLDDYLNTLEILLYSEDCLEYDEALLPIILHLAQYELRTRLNALYLIMINQIIMHSPFFEDELRRMAVEMYEHLMFILKNGKIISIQVNSSYFNSTISSDDRTKRDNTTRLQILYGYENFDSYVMRLDFSHPGQPFIHFNNASPGKVCSYLFNKEEYDDAISRYPLLDSCFVEYSNNRWALNERKNCDLTKEMEEMFESVESERMHKRVFSEEFSEDSVIKFIEIFSKLLPVDCYTRIDNEGDHARRCFNYDILIRNTTLFYLDYMGSSIKNNSESINRLIEDICTKAFNYGLISNAEQGSCNSLFWVYYILCTAEDEARSRHD